MYILYVCLVGTRQTIHVSFMHLMRWLMGKCKTFPINKIDRLINHASYAFEIMWGTRQCALCLTWSSNFCATFFFFFLLFGAFVIHFYTGYEWRVYWFLLVIIIIISFCAVNVMCLWRWRCQICPLFLLGLAQFHLTFSICFDGKWRISIISSKDIHKFEHNFNDCKSVTNSKTIIKHIF